MTHTIITPKYNLITSFNNQLSHTNLHRQGGFS